MKEKKRGTFVIRPDPEEREKLDRTIHDLDRIWEVGIVNAREDRQAIHEAVGFLETLRHIWHI